MLLAWVVITNKNPANWNVLTSEEHLCGGSIITRDRILTAAHCVKLFNKEKEEIRQKMKEEFKQLLINASKEGVKEEKLKKISSREIKYWKHFWTLHKWISLELKISKEMFVVAREHNLNKSDGESRHKICKEGHIMIWKYFNYKFWNFLDISYYRTLTIQNLLLMPNQL